MTREELLALAQQVGPDTDETDPLDVIVQSKGLILVADKMYMWDTATNDFECIE